MPGTPLTWLDDFIVNTNSSGSQYDPVITQLANGNILVVWVDYDDTSVAGAPAGSDIIGRIFDPLGNAVTNELRLNTRSTVNAEFNPSVTALANGDFVIAYDEAGTFDDLNLEHYSFNATTNTVTLVNDAYLYNDTSSAAGPNPVNPVIASASSTSAMTVYQTQNTDGSENIVMRTYDPTSNVVGAEVVIFAGATGTGEDVSGPDIAALSNGNYAITYVNRNPSPAMDSVIVEIRDQSGAFVNSATVDSVATELTDPQIVGLSNGNFVIAYADSVNNGDVAIRAFANNGTPLTGGGPFNAGTGSNSQNEPSIIGLADGSFIVARDDDTTGQIIAERWSVSGQNLGVISGFVIDDTGGLNITDISMAALADGRFTVTWEDGGDIRMKILDTRDFVNNPAVYSSPNWQVGTVGNDVFTTDDDADVVHGWTGNDDITDNGLSEDNKYFGDAGDDILRVTTAISGDSWDGGANTDTINWGNAATANGAIFDLAAGTAKQGANTEVMTGFENIIGSSFNDFLYGTSGVNVIKGSSGNDTIRGGAGGDDLDGGSGVNTLDYTTSTAGVKIDISANTASGGDAQGDDILHFQNVSGSNFNDALYGNSAANVLRGYVGNDTVDGRGGNDTVYGYDGNDVLRGGDGDDRVSGMAGNDSIEGNVGKDTLSGEAGADAFFYRTLGDSTVAKAGQDNILDFSHADGDRIKLSDIDAKTTAAGNNQFVFIGNAAFSGAEGELRYVKYATETYVYGDVNGDKKVDFAIHFDASITFVAGDFAL